MINPQRYNIIQKMTGIINENINAVTNMGTMPSYGGLAWVILPLSICVIQLSIWVLIYENDPHDVINLCKYLFCKTKPSAFIENSIRNYIPFLSYPRCRWRNFSGSSLQRISGHSGMGVRSRCSWVR